MTATARSLQALRRDRWIADVVERWIPRVNRRRDFLGIIDIIAVRPGELPLAIQCTSAANVSARLHKAQAEPRLRIWLATGSRFEVWGWGKVDGRWTVRKAMVERFGSTEELTVTRPPRRKRKRAEPCLFTPEVQANERSRGNPHSVANPRCRAGLARKRGYGSHAAGR